MGRPVVYFKHEDDGDGTYDGQIGHAYLYPDEQASEEDEEDLGFITFAAAEQLALERGALLDVDGPSRRDWERDVEGSRPSFLKRLLGR
jgi:hypothetical protein